MKHCDHLHWKLILSAVKGFVVLRSKARQRSDSGSVLYRRTMFSHRKVQTMSVFIKRFCLLFYFCILNHIISFVTFRIWV